jgi:hypothetical protein
MTIGVAVALAHLQDAACFVSAAPGIVTACARRRA